MARIAGPLQNLVIENRGNVFHVGAGEHFASQVQHDHGSGKAGCHGIEQGLGLGALHAVLQVAQEADAVHLHRVIQRQSKILGEGTLTGPVEAGNPDAYLVLAALFHG